MNELGLHAADLAGVAGSGAAGRVTVEDFERFIAHLEKQKITRRSSMRVTVADAMRRSWTRPLAHVGLPVLSRSAFCLSQSHPAQTRSGALLPCARWRWRWRKTAPAGRLVGNKIVHPSSIDIAFAVEAEEGVLVPVIRRADKQSLKDLIGPYNELVELARATQAARRKRRAVPLPPSRISARSG